jgi:CTP synthase (UTP-ammonia lyase)
MRNVRLALLGEHNPTGDTHVATEAAIRHSAAHLGRKISAEWISSTVISTAALGDYDGLWVAPGAPHLAIENSLVAIRHARETGLPVFANCGGFQLLVIEIARNLLGLSEAHHDEYAPSAGVKVVVPLSCSLKGQEMPITIESPSLAATLYNRTRVVERFYCRYGLNPLYRAQFLSGPVVVSGRDDGEEIRVIELPNHPFFLGTLYVPQVRSTEDAPHPLVAGFIEACARRGDKKSEGVGMPSNMFAM